MAQWHFVNHVGSTCKMSPVYTRIPRFITTSQI